MASHPIPRPRRDWIEPVVAFSVCFALLFAGLYFGLFPFGGSAGNRAASAAGGDKPTATAPDAQSTGLAAGMASEARALQAELPRRHGFFTVTAIRAEGPELALQVASSGAFSAVVVERIMADFAHSHYCARPRLRALLNSGGRLHFRVSDANGSVVDLRVASCTAARS